ARPGARGVSVALRRAQDPGADSVHPQDRQAPAELARVPVADQKTNAPCPILSIFFCRKGGRPRSPIRRTFHSSWSATLTGDSRNQARRWLRVATAVLGGIQSSLALDMTPSGKRKRCVLVCVFAVLSAPAQ